MKRIVQIHIGYVKCFDLYYKNDYKSSTQIITLLLSPFGNEMYRTAEPPHWLFPDWWSFRWKGNPLKGKWWGLKEWIPKLKAWMKYMRQTYISRGKSQFRMHFNLELFYFYSYSPTFPMNRGRQELQHSHTIPSTWQMSRILLWS